VIDDEECVRFLGKFTAAYHMSPPHLILDFDQSNWYLVMAREQTVAEQGVESVHQHVNDDPIKMMHATVSTRLPRLPEAANAARASLCARGSISDSSNWVGAVKADTLGIELIGSQKVRQANISHWTSVCLAR
jgi:hypothetical protein